MIVPDFQRLELQPDPRISEQAAMRALGGSGFIPTHDGPRPWCAKCWGEPLPGHLVCAQHSSGDCGSECACCNWSRAYNAALQRENNERELRGRLAYLLTDATAGLDSYYTDAPETTHAAHFEPTEREA